RRAPALGGSRPMRHLAARPTVAAAAFCVAATACEPAPAPLGRLHTTTLAMAHMAALTWLPPLDQETYGPEPPPPPCPEGMVHIGRYCIDRYEAHLVVPVGEGEYRLHPHYERPPDGVDYEARNAEGVFPQAYI